MTYNKDGKTYYFNSKRDDNLNCLYGVTPEIKRTVDDNLESQLNYLKNAFVNINEESYISLLDVNFSANLKPKQYYGEMFNRVNTLRKYAESQKFDTPVFITLTPPSYLKPLKQIRLGNSNKYKLVDNPRFCGCTDYVDMAREYISDKWIKFLRQRIFTEMKTKYGERLIYMRTYEPFLDGTPHVHIVAFIPSEYKERFVNLVKGYFSETRTDVKTEFDDGIGGVVAYILKYILKSFSSVKENKLDDVGYWYAYHKIRRFTTSRTLVPMSIYRKIKQHEDYQNLLEVTKLYKNNYIQVEVQYNPYKLYVKDHNDINSLDYQIATITIINNDSGVDTHYEILYKKSDNVSLYFIEPGVKNSKPLHVPINRAEPKKKQSYVPIHFENKKYILVGNDLKELITPVVRMRDTELLKHYFSLDIETCNLQHFGLVQNEVFGRSLLHGHIQSLNDFNTNIGV